MSSLKPNRRIEDESAKKILLMGDQGVGKTAFARRLMYGAFVEVRVTKPLSLRGKLTAEKGDDSESTLPARHQTTVGTRLGPANVVIYDTYDGGPCEAEASIRACDACILMYSVTMRHSFEDLIAQYKLLKSIKTGRPPTYALVATNCDARTWVVTREEGLFMAQALDCTLLETSSRTGAQVEVAISHVVGLVLEADMRTRRRRCSLTGLAERIAVHR